MNKFIDEESSENAKVMDDMKGKYNVNVKQTSRMAYDASSVEQKIM